MIGCGYTHPDRVKMMKHIVENHLRQFEELGKWGFNYVAIKDQYLKLVQSREDGKEKWKKSRRQISAQHKKALNEQMEKNLEKNRE